MGTIANTRLVLLCNATGAAGYGALHLYLAWARNLQVSVNFYLLALLFVAAVLSIRLGAGLAFYSLMLWFAVTAMTINYASDPRCTGIPGVALWLILGAAMTGASGNRQAIFYLQLSTVTFLWIVLVYCDAGYVLVRYPLVIGAALAGYIFREYERAKGQLDKLETALRILNNAPQGRESS